LNPPPPPPGGQLLASTAAVTFPATTLHTYVIRYLQIRNVGRGTLAGTVGALSAPFQVVSGGGNFRLASGYSRRIGIRFIPTAPGAASPETLSISSSGGSASVTVSGSGK